MDNNQDDQGLFKLLDRNIKRSNKLGDWSCPDLIDLSYWEIRYTLPEKIMEGIDAVVQHFTDKSITLANKTSFFFWIKDELTEIAMMEKRVLSSRKMRSKSFYTPSPRANQYYYLIELNDLSGGCPIKAEQIKEMKYSIIFETLLAKVINSEGEYKTD